MNIDPIFTETKVYYWSSPKVHCVFFLSTQKSAHWDLHIRSVWMHPAVLASSQVVYVDVSDPNTRKRVCFEKADANAAVNCTVLPLIDASTLSANAYKVYTTCWWQRGIYLLYITIIVWNKCLDGKTWTSMHISLGVVRIQPLKLCEES